ncbi:MAG TPA: TIGR03618 family F420-dependent PPOX class oxidoreductase [Methylomirabilota bacterium]|nr:TIGR03618 family F420-dependent PPOX class oxidoreductase [Methylomirabilota bacterium]
MTERLGDPKIQAFLGTKEVVVLATIQPDGAPLATPMWFLADADALAMISEADAQKVHNLRRDGRVCVVAEAGTRGDIRGVIVRGRAEILPDAETRRALVARFLDRYHPHLERRWGGRAMPADRVMFRIVPEHVQSWGLSL